MINTRYRLVATKQIIQSYVDENITEDKIIVRPTYLSICAADIRYFFGRRNPEILQKKLPLTLIHEAVGEVVYDPANDFKVGDKVVLLPLVDSENNPSIYKNNYDPKYKFRSSSADGFMQSTCVISKHNVILIKGVDDRISVFSELMSVIINGLDGIKSIDEKDTVKFAVWGDGSLGFVCALLLKKIYKNSHVTIVGKTKLKLNYFDFVDEVREITDDLSDFKIDVAFECVGGENVNRALDQIIDCLNPQGTISLLGVSENKVEINTRMILEKGLKLYGSSRASKDDFQRVVNLLEQDEDLRETLERIISDEVTVSSISDINKAFDSSISNYFKTIMKWEI